MSQKSTASPRNLLPPDIPPSGVPGPGDPMFSAPPAPGMEVPHNASALTSDQVLARIAQCDSHKSQAMRRGDTRALLEADADIRVLQLQLVRAYIVEAEALQPAWRRLHALTQPYVDAAGIELLQAEAAARLPVARLEAAQVRHTETTQLATYTQNAGMGLGATMVLGLAKRVLREMLASPSNATGLPELRKQMEGAQAGIETTTALIEKLG